MIKYGSKWSNMGQNLEIYVPKCYTKTVTNFKAFLEEEVQDKKYKYKTKS